jgi:hypothetical protein
MDVRSSIFIDVFYEEDTAICAHILNSRHKYGHMEDIKYIKGWVAKRNNREY